MARTKEAESVCHPAGVAWLRSLTIRRNSFASKMLKVDNPMLGCENEVKFYHTSAVEYLFGNIVRRMR